MPRVDQSTERRDRFDMDNRFLQREDRMAMMVSEEDLAMLISAVVRLPTGFSDWSVPALRDLKEFRKEAFATAEEHRPIARGNGKP